MFPGFKDTSVLSDAVEKFWQADSNSKLLWA